MSALVSGRAWEPVAAFSAAQAPIRLVVVLHLKAASEEEPRRRLVGIRTRVPVAKAAAQSSRASSTSSACSATFTFGKMWVIFPSFPMMKVVRSMPMYFFPYMDFSFHTS